MINAVVIILLICSLVMLIGVIFSKTIAERLMSLTCLTNYMLVAFCALSLFSGRSSYIDIAYIFALFGFIVNLAASKLKVKKKYD
jgi:multisubunit Na+/H+ antiporter MnhF subunit